MHHELKIQDYYLQNIIDGKKTFEIRYNDRDYQVGDTVKLSGSNDMPSVLAKIGYVTTFQQKENFVVFSLLEIEVQGALWKKDI